MVTIGKGNDVEVQLEFQEHAGISNIQFFTDTEMFLLTDKDLIGKHSIHCFFSEKGEGLVNVVVFTKVDTVSSQHYVERGYKVKLVYAGGKFSTVNPTGY